MNLLDILFGRKGIGRPPRERPKPRPRLEGRGEKPDTLKPDIDTGKWEKEFEDKILYWSQFDTIKDLIIQYIKPLSKVRIKCKNGCIQIERIK